MSRRFFVETPILENHPVTLVGQEAQHLGRVLRAKPGDQVIIFDGAGAQFSAEVAAVNRSEVELRVLSREEVDRESERQVVLAVAMPKGDRQRWLIEKAVELGVNQLIPLTTKRGVAQPTSSAIKRLERAVIEASKQCGRNRLMQIAEPLSVASLFENSATADLKLMAHPSGTAIDLGQVRAASHCWAAIGPEGGFSDEEVAAGIDAGWRLTGLGPRILRVETAALFLATWLSS